MKLFKFLALLSGAFFLISGLGLDGVLARDNFPAKHLAIVCGYGPGGSTDIEIRGIVPYLQKQLGRGIIIQNLTGASGLLANNKVFSAKPDGYTLLIAGFPTPTIVQKFFGKKAKYDTRKYSHIFAFAKRGIILVGNPETYRSFEDFVKASANKRLKVGVTGRGTPTQLAGVMLQEMAKIDLNVIPFDSGGESMTALAGKHIDAVVTIASTAIGLTKAGVVRPLLSMEANRIPGYSDTPSVKELGYDVSMQVPYVTGVVGPPKMPKDRLNILETAFAKAVKDPGYAKWCKGRNAEVLSLSSADFHKETMKAYAAVDKYIDILKK